jgi:hypothetical protein
MKSLTDTLLITICFLATPASILHAQTLKWGPMIQTTVDGQPVAYQLKNSIDRFSTAGSHRHEIAITNLGSRKIAITSVIDSSAGRQIYWLSSILIPAKTVNASLAGPELVGLREFYDEIENPEMVINGHVINDDTEIKWGNWGNDLRDARCQHAIGIQRKNGKYVHWLSLKDLDPDVILDIVVYGAGQMLGTKQSVTYQAAYQWSYTDENPQANFSWSVVGEQG